MQWIECESSGIKISCGSMFICCAIAARALDMNNTPDSHWRHVHTSTQAQTHKHKPKSIQAVKHVHRSWSKHWFPFLAGLSRSDWKKHHCTSVVSFWHRSDIIGVALRSIFSLVLCFLLCTSTCFTEHGQKHQRNHYERGGAATS